MDEEGRKSHFFSVSRLALSWMGTPPEADPEAAYRIPEENPDQEFLHRESLRHMARQYEAMKRELEILRTWKIRACASMIRLPEEGEELPGGPAEAAAKDLIRKVAIQIKRVAAMSDIIQAFLVQIWPRHQTFLLMSLDPPLPSDLVARHVLRHLLRLQQQQQQLQTNGDLPA